MASQGMLTSQVMAYDNPIDQGWFAPGATSVEWPFRLLG